MTDQADSSRQTASGIDTGMVTLDEARAAGLRMRTQPPTDTVNCKYCGKRLQPVGLKLYGEVVMWKPGPIRCDCAGAKAYWERRDAEEKRRTEERIEQENRAEMQKRIDRLLSDSGIRKRFQQRTFLNFRCDTEGRKRSYAIAKEYADNWQQHREHGDGLYIEGTNGTGKTHLAAAIALQLISQGIPVICKTSTDLLLDIKRTYNDPELREEQVLEVYSKVDLLIVDDLGKEQCSEWSMAMLYSIFNERYEAMRPVIITTNYNTDDLMKALTPKGSDGAAIEAIISRLHEVSTVITMAWKDIRGG